MKHYYAVVKDEVLSFTCRDCRDSFAIQCFHQTGVLAYTAFRRSLTASAVKNAKVFATCESWSSAIAYVNNLAT